MKRQYKSVPRFLSKQSVCRGTGTAGQRDHQCGGHTGRTWVCVYLGQPGFSREGGPRTSRGWLKRGTPGGGTQCAQRTGETVSGMKTTAGDDKRGHKGRAVCCTPLAELRSDMNLS
ncbi:hypothetical protein DPMN_000361 [Dreissena polymorpha]|uniref:Uncharacterized protein n=1 Tax=Dreissena polymorpha TaxID=45954 RepID=A0A9D4MHV7_DREPO|nr:hypothetical protein DPMN_000361 [Dreissena polymorpha]